MNRSRDEAECVPAEEWPNRRIIYLAIIVVLIAFLIFHLPEAIKTVFGIARDTIVVLILAVGLTYLLAPLHSLLMQVPWPPRKATRRQLYAIVAIVIFVGLLAGITKLVVTPLAEQTGQAVRAIGDWISDDFARSLDTAVNAIVEVVPEEYQPDLRARIDELKGSLGGDGFAETMRRWSGAVFDAQVAILRGIFSHGATVIGMLIVPVFAYYFLTDYPAIRKSVASHVSEQNRPRFHHALNDINTVLLGYARSMIVLSVVTGVSAGLLLYFTGVPAYLALGVLAGIGGMIPVLGPMVAFIATMGVSLLTVSPGTALLIMVAYGVIEFGSDRVLGPKLMAEGVGLHPVAIIVVLMLGGQFFGILGIFAAVPVAAALRLTYIHLRGWLVDEHHREALDELAGPKNGGEE